MRALLALFAALVLLLAVAPTARAQSAPGNTAGTGTAAPAPAAASPDTTHSKSPFASRPMGPPTAPAVVSSGPLHGLWVWLMRTQQQLHQSLSKAVRDFKTRDPFGAALALVLVSFGYGVFHAAGPGHGKAVISSYVLANERTVRRGIALSFLAAGIQGLSALVVVGILVLVLRVTGMTIKSTEGWIETISWALVALVGAWLLYAQLKVLVAGWRHTGSDDAHSHAHSPSHDHSRGSDCCAHGHEHPHHHGDDHAAELGAAAPRQIGGGSFTPTLARRPLADNAKGAMRTPTAHQHTHDGHGTCEACGHVHMPAPEDLQGPWRWSKALAIAFSVGIRPCTGAILVLVLAISQGMAWVGVISTFAMAIGTAITVSALAALAVGSRELAMRYAGRESRWGWRIERVAGIGGALLVMGLGSAFFVASLQPASPF